MLNLETKDFADFGTAYSDNTAYFAFYKGNKVVNRIIPTTSGVLKDFRWRHI